MGVGPFIRHLSQWCHLFLRYFSCWCRPIYTVPLPVVPNHIYVPSAMGVGPYLRHPGHWYRRTAKAFGVIEHIFMALRSVVSVHIYVTTVNGFGSYLRHSSQHYLVLPIFMVLQSLLSAHIYGTPASGVGAYWQIKQATQFLRKGKLNQLIIISIDIIKLTGR